MTRLQDKKDDKLVGVKSTALYFGEQTKPALAAWSSFFVTSLLVSGKVPARVCRRLAPEASYSLRGWGSPTW